MNSENLDMDNTWKELIDNLFEFFIAFFFPQFYAIIDWSRNIEFLDKEFQQVVETAQLSSREADKLVKVWYKNGEEAWFLIHIEVQSQWDEQFAQRMFIYNTLIYHRYRKEVISLAILGDENPLWKPDFFGYNQDGFQMAMQFPVVKLIEFYKNWELLETSNNPFAIAVMVYLITLKTRKSPEDRFRFKLEIAKKLRERGLSHDAIVRIYRFADVFMKLPDLLEKTFVQEYRNYQKEKNMTNIMAPFEEIAYEKGKKEGWEEGREEGILNKSQSDIIEILDYRFGFVSDEVSKKINDLDDIPILKSLFKVALKVNSIDEFTIELHEFCR